MYQFASQKLYKYLWGSNYGSSSNSSHQQQLNRTDLLATAFCSENPFKLLYFLLSSAYTGKHTYTHMLRFQCIENSFSFIKNEQNWGYSGSNSKVFIITEWFAVLMHCPLNFTTSSEKLVHCGKWWNLSANSILNGSQYHFYSVSKHIQTHNI